MIETVLQQPLATARDRIGAWRQLTDILAQRGDRLPLDIAARGLRALAVLRDSIPVPIRRATAAAVARRVRFAPLVAFYGADEASVARAMLSQVQMSDAAWQAYLPASNPVSRATLRERSDLSPAVERQIAAFGEASLRLPHAAVEATADEPVAEAEAPEAAAPNQISELVARIRSFRDRRSAPQRAESAGDAAAPSHFHFWAGPDGTIVDADGIARGAVVGMTLARPAIPGHSGTDAAACGAYAHRAEIVDARLLLGEGSAVAGDWRFSAVPRFDAMTGQFVGYAGIARRPSATESAVPPHRTGNAGPMRELVHELRSPITAISGFSQIIEEQIFGPVAGPYRDMARSIHNDARQLLSVIQQMDDVSRLTADQRPAPAAAETLSGFVLATVAAYEESTEWESGRPPIAAAVDGDADAVTIAWGDDGHRMLFRLLAALSPAARAGETLRVGYGPSRMLPGAADIRLSLPERLAGVDADGLFDSAWEPDGTRATPSVLGLGFALRVVERAARKAGGALLMDGATLTLRIPCATADTSMHRIVPGE